MDATLAKLVAQIMFAFAAIVFTIYSIIAIYSFNTYGRTRSLTTAVSLVYSALAAALLSWGLFIVKNIE